jgi:hypothetical protein
MKTILLYILLFFSVTSVFSQEPPVKKIAIDEYLDELLLEEESLDALFASLINFNFLYISVNYNTDTYFSGRDIDIDQYNVSPQITYMHSKGFYASISGIYYSEFIPHWDVTTATVGYGKSFGKDKIWRYYSSLSAYLYSDNNIEGLYKGNINAGFGIQNKKRTLGTSLSGSYYLGGDDTYQIVSRSYANLKLLKTKKHHLKIRPQLSIYSGTQIVDVLSNTTLQNGNIEQLYTQNNIFGLINTQVNFPIQYSINSFDFELGYNLNFPSEIGDESNLKNTSFFNIGISYLLDL